MTDSFGIGRQIFIIQIQGYGTPRHTNANVNGNDNITDMVWYYNYILKVKKDYPSQSFIRSYLIIGVAQLFHNA